MKWLLLLLPFVLATSATAAVCGSGGGTPAPFVFTPVPYTYIPGPGGTPIPVSIPPEATADRCYPYVADEVDVEIDTEHVDAFKSWLSTVGFAVTSEPQIVPPPHPALLRLEVPLGSVPDAIKLVKEQDGVVTVDRNSLGKLPESPNLPVCPATPVQ